MPQPNAPNAPTAAAPRDGTPVARHRTPKPTALLPDFGSMPAELRMHARWVLWRYERREGSGSRLGKWTKVPLCAANGRNASSTDPSTWAIFGDAQNAYCSGVGDADGVGWVVGEGIVGVDVDDCRDPITGQLSLDAQHIIATVNSYTEVSPSGTGVRIFARGHLPPNGRKRGPFEAYDGDGGRYLTVTGALPVTLTPATIEVRTDELAVIHAHYIALPKPKASTNGHPRPAATGTWRHMSDADVLEVMRRSKNGDALGKLYDGDLSAYGGDQSTGDMALCGALGFFTGYDPAQMDRLYRASCLMRDKWDRSARHGETYGEGTLREAIEGKGPGDGYPGRRPPSAGEGPPRDPTDPGPSGDESAILPVIDAKGRGAALANRRPHLVQLSTVQREAVEHLDDGRLALKKFTLMMGDAGIGKTNIALALAANITRGLPVLPKALSPGSHSRPPANVLALIGEDGLADTIRARFDDAAGDANRFYALTDVLHTAEDGTIREGEVDLTQLDVIEAALDEARPLLMIVDPIQVYMGAGVDMHRANEVRTSLKGVARLAEKYGTSLLVLAHMNKGTGKALYRALGSVDFVAIARSVLVAGLYNGEPALAHAKANLSARAPTLTYTLEGGCLAWTGTSNATADDLTGQPQTSYEAPKESEAAAWLEAQLADGPRRSTETLRRAAEQGIAERTLKRAKASLGVVARRVGAAGSEGHWEWLLPGVSA